MRWMAFEEEKREGGALFRKSLACLSMFLILIESPLFILISLGVPFRYRGMYLLHIV